MLVQIHASKSCFNIYGLGILENGCSQSGEGTLKLTVSQKCTDRINWFIGWWYKFREAKSWFNDFWVGMVKNNHVFLVHEILKSCVLRIDLRIKLIFLMLIVTQWFLVGLISFSLTFRCWGSTGFVLHFEQCCCIAM